MIKQKLCAIFDVIWLPLLLIAGTSWLYAPFIDAVRYGGLQVISSYEATGANYGWLFRAGDALGAAIVIAAVVRSRLLTRQRLLSWLLVTFSILVIVDVVFVVGCNGACTVWNGISHTVHVVESVISLIVLAAATAYDALRNRNYVSRLFLSLQATVGLLTASGLFSHQIMVVLQFVYQIFVIAWLGYVLRRFLPVAKVPLAQGATVRLVLTALICVVGLLEITAAYHFRSHNGVPGHIPVFLAQHAVLAGAVMLYLARQVYRGEQRAAIIVAIVSLSLVVKYALFTPQPYLLAIIQLTLVGLWLYADSFVRNLGVPPLVQRLRNLGVLVAGVVIAICLVFAVATLSGRQAALRYDMTHVFSNSLAGGRRNEDRVERRLRHFQIVTTTLAVTLVAGLLWSLFRPSRGILQVDALSRDQVSRLLARYATSSEDYFKLWPADKSYYHIAEVEGFVAYKRVGSTVFALADPICAPEYTARLLQAFVAKCRAHGWSVCFLLVGSDSRNLYTSVGLRTMQIGSSAVVSVEEFSTQTARDKWWRWQLNRSTKAGMSYSIAQPPHDKSLLAETSALSHSWLTRGGHNEQGFALGYYDDDYLQQCKLHLLRDDTGRLVAFCNQLPVFNGQRQTTVDLIRFDPDVNGAMPTVIARLIQSVAESGTYSQFDLGFVPLAKLDSRLASIARRIVASRYSAAGLEQFKGKFKPDWQPQYIAYDGDVVDLAGVIARLESAMKA